VNPTFVPTTRPSEEPTTNATQTKAPVEEPTLAPVETVPPELTPGPTVGTTTKPTVITSRENFGNVVANKCIFRMVPAGTKCVQVETFDEFKVAVETGRSGEILFCGGFNYRKTGLEPVDVSRDVDIRCVNKCSFYGVGPFLNIGGVTKTRLENLKFVNSRDSSAVVVSTSTGASQTTFCNTEFSRNQVSIDKSDLGGALTIKSKSGVVNIVNNTFTGNIASRGGAILSNGFKLNILESKFVANNAYDSGNAIFVGNGRHLSIESTTFILNTEVSTRYSGREKTGYGSKNGFAIVVQPNTSIRAASHQGSTADYGNNKSMLNGKCDGIFLQSTGQCEAFD
jgi:hypothetical protein